MTPYDNVRVGSRENLSTMLRILSGNNSGLKICHINAQSLNNKIDEFRLLFENSKIDIICISETWFFADVSNNIYNLNGYRLFRSDRSTNGGGVAIYIKASINCKQRIKNLGGDIEYIFIEIYSGNEKLLVGTVYRPNRNIDMDPILEVLDTYSLGYNHIILTGDFNANILEDNSLLVDMGAIGLYLANGMNPTHFTSTSSTLLDLCFINDTSRLLLFDQLSASMFSRHDLLFISYDFELIRIPHIRMIQYRDFNNIDYTCLGADLLSLDWSNVLFNSVVDEQLNFFDRNFRYLFDRHVQMRCRIFRDDKPWFTAEIRNLINIRNYAYTRWKRFRTPELYECFKAARTSVNTSIRRAKVIFYGNKFRTCVDSRTKWREIYKVGLANRDNADPGVIDVNQVNQQFCAITMPPVNIDYYGGIILAGSRPHEFNFVHFTQEEVLRSFLDVRSNAIGYDGIHPRFIKMTLPYSLTYFTHFFNTIITTSTFPSMWKHAKIVPVLKSDKSFRPIAILPYLSKVFEKLMHSQISRYLYTHSLLTERQSGFKPKHSCLSALVDVTEEIRSQVDKRNTLSFLVLLDHSKAFDTVHHSILDLKLRYICNFSSTALKLLSSYLSNRTQSVFHNSNVSRSCSMPRGVPQGSILGPLLYSIYANDLPLQMRHCQIQMYADDVQLYISCNISDAPNCIRLINDDLHRIYLWASANGLSINPNKSAALLVGPSGNLISHLPPIHINGTRIKFVNSAKNLGVIMNRELNWSDHIRTNCGRTYAMLRNLWMSQYFTPIHIRMLLAKTYLLPTLIYGCELFASCDAVSRRRLNVTFNTIARYVFGIRRGRSISQYARQISGISFDDLLKCRTLLFLHRVIYTQQPPYLYRRIIFSRSNRGNRLNFVKYNRAISGQHFFINSIRLWNQLPSQIQTISNANHFKTAIFKHFS